MSYSSKSKEHNLSAIYRLEFYKKQDSWNISSSRKAKTSPQNSAEIKTNLNAMDNPEMEDTYSDITEKSNYIKSKPDKKNKDLSQEGQKSTNIRPKSVTWDPSVKEVNRETSVKLTRSRPSAKKARRTRYDDYDMTYQTYDIDMTDDCEKISNSECVTLLDTPKTNISTRLKELQNAAIDKKNKEVSQEGQESTNIRPKSVTWHPPVEEVNCESSVKLTQSRPSAKNARRTRYDDYDMTYQTYDIDMTDDCEKISNSECVTLLDTPKTNISIRLKELQNAAMLHLKEQTNAEDCSENLFERNISNEACAWDGQYNEDSPLETDVLNIANVGSDISSQVSQTDVTDGMHYP